MWDSYGGELRVAGIAGGVQFRLGFGHVFFPARVTKSVRDAQCVASVNLMAARLGDCVAPRADSDEVVCGRGSKSAAVAGIHAGLLVNWRTAHAQCGAEHSGEDDGQRKPAEGFEDGVHSFKLFR